MFDKDKIIEAAKNTRSRSNRLFPSALAFYLILVLIGAISLSTVIATILGDDLTFFKLLIEAILPASGELLNDYFSYLETTRVTNSIVMTIVAMVPLIWLTSHGYVTMSLMIREAYKVPKKSSFKGRMKSMLFSFVLISVMVVGAGILTFILTDFLSFNGITLNIFWVLIGVSIVFACLYVLFWLPVRNIVRFRDVLPGTILATLGILLIATFSGLFSFYFARYNMLYGPMSSILILLVTIGFIAKAIHFGILYNVLHFDDSYVIKGNSVIKMLKEKIHDVKQSYLDKKHRGNNKNDETEPKA